eukprot:TRINITY_DN34859_c0_g1_i1.p1 TRINITY_DN34859_c0_g1~~TRINITY_DN34859_c0_g1_i1.p1  ORF type:complete len:357 (+),score=71.28 TRINITY_DN34859_c0_g1_i1:58-1071(+)
MDFEIDIKKVNYVPKRVEEISEWASKAFECPMTFEELQNHAYGVIGTDKIEKVQINEDADIPKFEAIKCKTRFEEKVIKFQLPDRAVPADFVPKKTKILAKGQLFAKFFGECEVSTRTVEFSLKLYDCGHFYMKQALPEAGASPYWVIFEGTWEQTDRGLALEYLFRYSWQLNKTRLMPEFALEATPKNHKSRLAWCGDIPEQQLNGMFPAIVGEEAFSWVEVCREPDKVERGKARFNVEEDDIVKPEKPADEEPMSTARRRPQASGSQAPASGPPAGGRTENAAGQPETHSSKEPASAEATDEEPAWPLYVAAAIFLLLFLFFCRSTWDSKTQAAY